MHLFCFGVGYIGTQWLESFPKTAKKSGTTTTPDKAFSLSNKNIEAHLFDGNFSLEGITHMLISIPPDEEVGDLVLEQFRDEVLKMKSLQWVGLLSTTGVYGDHGGALVNESSICSPTSPKTQARLDAEKQWLELWEAHNLPIHIFRLSGIYGPDRSLVDRIIEGKSQRIDKPGHQFSRIHADDIIQVLQKSMDAPNPGSIYNLSDGHPAATREIIEHVCGELVLPLPPLINFETADLSPMLRFFYKDNKRVSNQKLQSGLDVKLKYPSYKEGLREEIERHKMGPQ